jgi:catechol 2,3-dioxygenase-like lactoylglutathione lyase family enzyme
MDLGAFSVSLAVHDLEASRRFYVGLGFDVVQGDAGQGWLILRNGGHTIGLFQGMLERNTLTFNPGWDDEGNPVDPYTDVRDLQRMLMEQGIEPITAVDEAGSGPGFFILADPDGNPIFVDQHV